MAAHALDDRETYRRLDPQGMTALVVRFPEMGDEAWRTAMRLRLPETIDATAVVVLGMGGSGVGGDLLASLLAPAFPVPVLVVKDRAVPAFVGPQTLVFACSYSGNTAETLEAYGQVRAAGAPVIVITSGGTLGRLAADGGVPLMTVPAGLPPRAALPYLFLPMVSALRRLTHMGELSGDWAEAKRVLQRLVADLHPDVPAERNAAKALAVRLAGRTPVIYAAVQALAPVAYRWKTQLNENAKVFAVWNTFPELQHNEVVGWEDSSVGPRAAVVLLKLGPDDVGGIAAAREVAFRSAASIDQVEARGESLLARLLSLVLFGDFVSAYAALLRGVDPWPVAVIDELKRRAGPGSKL